MDLPICVDRYVRTKGLTLAVSTSHLGLRDY